MAKEKVFNFNLNLKLKKTSLKFGKCVTFSQRHIYFNQCMSTHRDLHNEIYTLHCSKKKIASFPFYRIKMNHHSWLNPEWEDYKCWRWIIRSTVYDLTKHDIVFFFQKCISTIENEGKRCKCQTIYIHIMHLC